MTDSAVNVTPPPTDIDSVFGISTSRCSSVLDVDSVEFDELSRDLYSFVKNALSDSHASAAENMKSAGSCDHVALGGGAVTNDTGGERLVELKKAGEHTGGTVHEEACADDDDYRGEELLVIKSADLVKTHETAAHLRVKDSSGVGDGGSGKNNGDGGNGEDGENESGSFVSDPDVPGQRHRGGKCDPEELKNAEFGRLHNERRFLLPWFTLYIYIYIHMYIPYLYIK